MREVAPGLWDWQAEHPEWWRQGPNEGYRHWVAQIAIRAIDRSYDAEPPPAANT